MTDYSQGILAEASNDASFVFLDVTKGREQDVVTALSKLPELVTNIQSSFKGSELYAVVGISIHGWKKLFTFDTPRELGTFPSLDGSDMQLKDIAHDLVLHVRSDRRDASHSLAIALYQAFGGSVAVSEQVNCFKYRDNRDFTGFVDGTENPAGSNRAKVALIGDDAQYVNGSYLNTMKFVHNLVKWEQLSVKDQEDTYGRTKNENIEYAGNDKALTAHTKRTSLKNGSGESLEILRHSMPFGDLKEQGLLFASYAHTPTHFNAMLESMILGDDNGHTDHLMKYTASEGGSLFFIPSADFLTQLTSDK